MDQEQEMQKLREENAMWRKLYLHDNAMKYDDVYFICGEAGTRDAYGLPQFIFVSPARGLGGFACYTKTKDYFAPGY